MPSLSPNNRKPASSPYINRFLQPDSIIPYPSNPQSWNRYSYVANRPVNFSDPTGHAMETDSDAGSCDADCWKNLQTRRRFEKERENLNFDLQLSPDFKFTCTGCPQSSMPYDYNTPTVKRSGTMVIIVMPEGSTSTLQRPNWARRLGTAFGIAGFLFDIGEMVTIVDLLPGDEDLAALSDVGITYLSSAFGGDSYVFERPDPSLPYMVTVNQDVIFTAGDAGLAALVKYGGFVIGGPVGYLVGEGTDVVTTGASIVYDGSRVFGNLQNYVSVGVAVTPTDQIHIGDLVVLFWPN